MSIREWSTSGTGSPLSSYVHESVDGMWVTSPFIHMEVAMAFQAGLPIRVIVERGVVTDGVLDDRVLGTQYKVEVDFSGCRSVEEILDDEHWKEPPARVGGQGPPDPEPQG